MVRPTTRDATVRTAIERQVVVLFLTEANRFIDLAINRGPRKAARARRARWGSAHLLAAVPTTSHDAVLRPPNGQGLASTSKMISFVIRPLSFVYSATALAGQGIPDAPGDQAASCHDRAIFGTMLTSLSSADDRQFASRGHRLPPTGPE